MKLRAWSVVVVALALAGGGGAWWWRTQRRAPEAGQARCKHQLEPAACPFCDKGLAAKKGACPEHGWPEALCVRCHPELEAGFRAENDWCAGHKLPESQCLACNPELAAKLPAARRPEGELDVKLVQQDEVPPSRRAPSVACQNHKSLVQFASVQIARAAGLEAVPVERRAIASVLTVAAVVAYDANLYAQLSSRAPGVVHQVRKDLGEAVEADEVLAWVDSAELGTAQAEYLQAAELLRLAETNHQREQSLVKSGAGTQKDLLDAAAKVEEARIARDRAEQKLKNLGLKAAQIEALALRRKPSSLLPLAAPFAGTVVARQATKGEVVDTARPLLAVADTRQMWALLELPEEEVARVRPGQSVVLSVDALRGESFPGKIQWVASELDPKTRTLRARAVVANRDGLLRAHMFGRAQVTLKPAAPAVVVPKDAVQWEGCCNLVFVQRTPTLYEPRKVRLGIDTGTWVEVLEGLEADSDPRKNVRVATRGSFLLKTEILKGSIGAGCCEPEPGKK